MISPRMAFGRSLTCGPDEILCVLQIQGQTLAASLHTPEGRCTTGVAGGANLIFLLLGAADSISIARVAPPPLQLSVRWIWKEG